MQPRCSLRSPLQGRDQATAALPTRGISDLYSVDLLGRRQRGGGSCRCEVLVAVPTVAGGGGQGEDLVSSHGTGHGRGP